METSARLSAAPAGSGADGTSDLRCMIDAVMEGVCVLDGKARLTLCNRSFVEMTGYEEGEAAGRNLCQLLHSIPPQEQGRMPHRCALPKTEHDLQQQENVGESLRRKDGTIFPARCWLRTWKSSYEGIQHVVTIKDISELERTKEVLDRSEERFARILKNAPDVAWTADLEGRTVYISPKVEAVLGYTKDEFSTGHQLRLGCIHPADFGRVTEAYRSLFNNQSSLDIEYRFRRKDGKWIWVQERATTIHEEDGVRYADGFLCDITARKEAEAALQFQKAFLEAQANCTIDGILVVDPGGRTLLRNQRFTEIFHLPEELESIREDGRLLRHVASLMNNPEAFLARVDYLSKHPNETGRDELELKNGKFLDRYSSRVVDREGVYYGRIWTFRDITERKRNEDELQQLSLAVEQSPVSVMITDPEGTIGYVNRKFSECSGYSRDEVVGKNPRILKSGSLSLELYQHLWSTIKQGKIWSGEFCNKKKNGEIYWEAASITPITNAKGEITHFLAIKEDITERRALEAQLRQAQKLEGIGHLAAGIAHEINTPTQFVTDNLTFMQDSWKSVFEIIQKYQRLVRDPGNGLPPAVLASLQDAETSCDLEFIAIEVPRAIDQSLDGARRVAKIVRAMKEFSHPDSAEKTATDLNRAIESTITVARNEWKYVSEIVTEFDDSMPAVVCYPGDINQVVLNLIVNAAHTIKDKVKEGEKGRITVRTRNRGELVEISVEDTGSGIPPAIQGKVFDPFFTTKEVGKGTGQGLSFAYTVIVKKHGGKIWFETEVGKGTTFFVTLPASGDVTGM